MKDIAEGVSQGQRPLRLGALGWDGGRGGRVTWGLGAGEEGAALEQEQGQAGCGASGAGWDGMGWGEDSGAQQPRVDWDVLEPRPRGEAAQVAKARV